MSAVDDAGGSIALSGTAPVSRRSRLLAAASSGGATAVLCGVAPVAAALSALALVFALLFRKPTRWIAIFAWGLAFHVVVMAALFGGLGIPGPVVRVFAAWKEAAVLLLVFSVIVRGASGRLARITISPNDLVIAAFLGLAVVYLLLFGAWSVDHTTFLARLYGLRDAAFFMLLYFVGRTTPELAENDRLLRVFIALGVTTTLIAILERLFVTPQMLVVLGAANYFRDFLGTASLTLGNDYGLPQNYWTAFGSRVVQRAGSVYLSSQGFAISFLLIVPAATVRMLNTRRGAIAWLGYVLLWVGLVLTVTRMSMIACVVEVLVIAVAVRRYDLFAWTAGVVSALFLLALAVVRGLPTFMWETIAWETGSSGSHLKDYGKGFQALMSNPLGSGLGTADLTAVRFGLNPLTADNQFLKYGAELGLPGLILIVVMLCGIGLAAARLVRNSSPGPERQLAVIVLAATIGIALNGVSAVPFSCMIVAYLYFWMAGVTVTHASRISRESRL